MMVNLLFWTSYLLWLHQKIKNWTKPTTLSLISGIRFDLMRSRTDLMIENALLRQQLIVLNRQVKRPLLTNQNRICLVLLARCTRFWKQAVLVVQPDTALPWHRELFRFYWRWKSKNKLKEPRIPAETIELIRKMAKENHLWGAERIRGELLKVGIKVSKRTIQKYLPRVRKSPSPSQTWATFLKNHARDIWACDLTVTNDWLFRPWFIFVIMELKTRRIVHTAVTRSPADQWTAQQLREAPPWGKGPEYLLHDRDKKYGPNFSTIASISVIKGLKTPYRTPRANSFCERYLGSLRRECLDHTIIFHGGQLRRVVKEYVVYYNQDRPHQGIGQRIPELFHRPKTKPVGNVISRAILGGLHHSYSRAIIPS